MRTPINTIGDIKEQPPITPWNLGVFDALVLADKMTGCPGGGAFVKRAEAKRDGAFAAVAALPSVHFKQTAGSAHI